MWLQLDKTSRHAGNSDQPKTDQDIPEEEWLDMDKPPQVPDVGEASKLAGEAGEGSKAVGKPTSTGAERGAEAPPEKAVVPPKIPTKNPQGPQPGTSKDDPQNPTEDPQVA